MNMIIWNNKTIYSSEDLNATIELAKSLAMDNKRNEYFIVTDESREWKEEFWKGADGKLNSVAIG